MTDLIRYQFHKMRPEAGRPGDPKVTGRFTLNFDNLTKDEAAGYLLLLMKHQEAREPFPNPVIKEEIDRMVVERLVNNAAV